MLKSVTIEAYVYPLVIALAIPLVIGLSGPALMERLLYSVILLGAALVPLYILYRAFREWKFHDRSLIFAILKNIRPLPVGLVYRTDLKAGHWPAGTVLLIFINILVHFTVSPEAVRQFSFFPAGDPGAGQILLSVFTSTFLHINWLHLFGNVFFLWVFGSALESRIQTGRFLFVYFFSIVLSKAFVFTLLCFQAGFTDIQSAIMGFRSIGASGAVAGVMGAFVVRCFFARLFFTLPLLFLPFVSVPFRVQASVYIALFFTADIAGSVHQFQGGGEVNYWAHVGGYMGAIVLSYLMGFQNEAIREAVHVKAERYSTRENYGPEAVEAYSEILKNNGEDEKALAFFFHLHRFEPEKQAAYFARWIHLLAETDYPRAKNLFDEYYPRFVNHINGKILLRLGSEFSKNEDSIKAKLCLEHASEKQGPWQEKALLELGEVYRKMELDERAKLVYERIIELSPDTEFGREAKTRLDAISFPRG